MAPHDRKRLLIIDGGAISYDGSPKAFLDQFSLHKKIRCSLNKPIEVVAGLIPEGLEIVNRDDETEIELLAGSDVDVTKFVQSKAMDYVRTFIVEEESLHDVLGRRYED